MFARGHFLWALCPLGVVIGAAAVASAAPGSRPSLPDSVDSHVVSIMTRIEVIASALKEHQRTAKNRGR